MQKSRYGTTRTAEVQGVGCSAAMCSRVFINAKEDSHSTAKIWLDSIAAIKGVSKDAALFVLKDGTERLLAFIPDFRVLYIARPNGDSEKLTPGLIVILNDDLTYRQIFFDVLVHEYLDVDHARLYSTMTNNLGDFEKLIKAVMKLL